MRVKGPTGGAPPVDETSRTGATAPTGSVEGTSGPSATAPVAGTAPVAAGDVVSEVARRLRAGEISPQQAVELLIDDAVSRQVGRVTSDRAALAAELKELLRRYTETDPYLASKVRRLGNKT